MAVRTLEDIGYWISPEGQMVDVYNPMSTHEQVAKDLLGDQAEDRPINKLVRKGWVRVSMGTLFHAKRFNGVQKELVKSFIRNNYQLYEDGTIELQSQDETVLVPVKEFLEE
jgi:hypothetical protein